jgi:hypothetical protein
MEFASSPFGTWVLEHRQAGRDEIESFMTTGWTGLKENFTCGLFAIFGCGKFQIAFTF